MNGFYAPFYKMCLDIIRNARPRTAKKDITVYKVLEIHFRREFNGLPFSGVINGVECSGALSVENNRLYFCTDSPLLDGTGCYKKYGRKYSWIFSDNANANDITVNGRPLADAIFYVTPYQRFCAEMGMEYDAKIRRYYSAVKEGLHSFADMKDAVVEARHKRAAIAECVIPKGAKYYAGTHDEHVSYASDRIRYVRIVSDTQAR